MPKEVKSYKKSTITGRSEDDHRLITGFTREVFAVNESDALQKYEESVETSLDLKDHQDNSGSYSTCKVTNISNVQVFNASEVYRHSDDLFIDDIGMKQATPLKFHYIPSDDSYLSSDNDWSCCPDQFVGVYGHLRLGSFRL